MTIGQTHAHDLFVAWRTRRRGRVWSRFGRRPGVSRNAPTSATRCRAVHEFCLWVSGVLLSQASLIGWSRTFLGGGRLPFVVRNCFWRADGTRLSFPNVFAGQTASVWGTRTFLVGKRESFAVPERFWRANGSRLEAENVFSRRTRLICKELRKRFVLIRCSPARGNLLASQDFRSLRDFGSLFPFKVSSPPFRSASWPRIRFPPS